MSNCDYHPNNITGKKVIISALDWGMGHTTRCVSIIRKLIDSNNEVVFVGNNAQTSFIKKDFPSIKTKVLDGYNITLDSKKNTYLQLGAQRKKVNAVIKKENQWLAKYVESNPVDIIISDNRYGFYHVDVPSIILTHQINLQIPFFKFTTNLFIRKMINKFDSCWIPDDVDHRLTGELSKGKLKIPIQFIGPLCRFDLIEAKKMFDYLVILSGPEPERSNFLEYAKEEITILGGTVAFVGAQVDGFESILNPSTSELSKLIASSECVFSRAGYTTIMEMTHLNKKAILVPTKGQYEQEYLANFVKSENIRFV